MVQISIEYTILGSVVVFFGIMFTSVLKIWDFIVKRRDRELDDVISEFNGVIIKNNLNDIKNKENVLHQDLNELRDNLNIPIEFKNLRKEAIKNGEITYGLLTASVVFAILSVIFPDFEFQDLTFLIATFVLAIGFFLYFVQYWQSLSELREALEEIESRIQDKKSVM